jgi:hypothetical protein
MRHADFMTIAGRKEHWQAIGRQHGDRQRTVAGIRRVRLGRRQYAIPGMEHARAVYLAEPLYVRHGSTGFGTERVEQPLAIGVHRDRRIVTVLRKVETAPACFAVAAMPRRHEGMHTVRQRPGGPEQGLRHGPVPAA